MLTRDSYIALLEKRATDESSVPVNDSAQVTTSEYNKNQEDNRHYLNSIFPNAGAVQSDMTATVKKLFPNAEGTKITGHPLIKMASKDVFFTSVKEQGLLKTAAPLHLEIAYSAFCDELNKIAFTRNI